jgi:hypothetical protein
MEEHDEGEARLGAEVIRAGNVKKKVDVVGPYPMELQAMN